MNKSEADKADERSHHGAHDMDGEVAEKSEKRVSQSRQEGNLRRSRKRKRGKDSSTDAPTGY